MKNPALGRVLECYVSSEKNHSAPLHKTPRTQYLLGATLGLAVLEDHADLGLDDLGAAAPVARQQVGRRRVFLAGLLELVSVRLLGRAFDHMEWWLCGHAASIPAFSKASASRLRSSSRV